MKEALIDEIRQISIHNIKNKCIKLQKIADETNRKALFASQFEERIAQGGSVEATPYRMKKGCFRRVARTVN